MHIVFSWSSLERFTEKRYYIAQKLKFSIKDFFIKC